MEQNDWRWEQEDEAVLQKWGQDSGAEECHTHRHKERNIRRMTDQKFEELRKSGTIFYNCYKT
jgi:hypothetical protein